MDKDEQTVLLGKHQGQVQRCGEANEPSGRCFPPQGWAPLGMPQRLRLVLLTIKNNHTTRVFLTSPWTCAPISAPGRGKADLGRAGGLAEGHVPKYFYLEKRLLGVRDRPAPKSTFYVVPAALGRRAGLRERGRSHPQCPELPQR